MGIPSGHKHLRTIIETSEGDQFLFQEATVANLVRAYTTIKTHPQKRAIELKMEHLIEKKTEFAEFQLIETQREEKAIIEELSEFKKEAKA